MAFARMDQGTEQDWRHIATEHRAHQESAPDQILGHLRALQGVTGGFDVDQLHHAVMTASLAESAGASDEMILVSLCHDLGKVISIPNHAAIGAEIMKPYVSNDSYHLLLTHQDFQGRYYYNFFGRPTDLREQYREESWYAQGCQFSDEWDQVAFDPEFTPKPLDHFEPLIREFFTKPRGM